jgi:ethanolamine utilization microcompartment shell protein EutL
LRSVTCPRAATVAAYGIMPNGVIVTVAELEGGAGAAAGEGAGEGRVGLAGVEPHAVTANVSVSATTHEPGKCFSRDVTVVCRNG